MHGLSYTYSSADKGVGVEVVDVDLSTVAAGADTNLHTHTFTHGYGCMHEYVHTSVPVHPLPTAIPCRLILVVPSQVVIN